MSSRSVLLILLSLTFLLFPFVMPPEEAQSNFFVFLGRFHPLLIHFPIALIILLLCIEIYESILAITKDDLVPFKYKEALLTLTFLSCVISTSLGFFLYQGGEYQGQMVRNHLVAAVILTVLMAFSLYSFFKHNNGKEDYPSWLYKGSIVLASCLLFYTSHIGGTITHGPNYLTEHSPLKAGNMASEVEKKDPEQLLLFSDILMPIMRSKCQSCHNEYKTKGGLRLTAFNEMLAGGKSKKSMAVPNDPEASELYRRLILPDADDEHMPPVEKPGLTDEEIELFKIWILEGANSEIMVSDLNDKVTSQTAIKNYLPKLYKSERAFSKQQGDNEEIAKELSKFGKDLGLVIEPDNTQGLGYFAVSMQMPPAIIDDNTINKLLKHEDLITKLSLPGSDISDDALFYISKMKNLRQLYIPKTAVTGEGIIYLTSLEKLEAINLSDTKLTDKDLLNTVHLKNLTKCFVANNELSESIVEAISLNRPTLQLLLEEGPYY